MNCKGCGVKKKYKGKTEYCLPCWQKVGLKGLAKEDPEGFEAKRLAAIKRAFQADPTIRQRMSAVQKELHNTPEARARKSAAAKKQKPWLSANNNRPKGSASRMQAGKRVTATKLAWCPEHLLDDYRHLIRSKRMLAKDAKQLILDQHEFELRKLRRKMGVPEGAGKIKLPPLPDYSNHNPTTNERSQDHLAKVRAEKVRVEALRVNRGTCPICGARTDLGCEHGEVA